MTKPPINPYPADFKKIKITDQKIPWFVKTLKLNFTDEIFTYQALKNKWISQGCD